MASVSPRISAASSNVPALFQDLGCQRVAETVRTRAGYTGCAEYGTHGPRHVSHERARVAMAAPEVKGAISASSSAFDLLLGMAAYLSFWSIARQGWNSETEIYRRVFPRGHPRPGSAPPSHPFSEPLLGVAPLHRVHVAVARNHGGIQACPVLGGAIIGVLPPVQLQQPDSLGNVRPSWSAAASRLGR